MTKVLVHGVPETADVWGPLVAALASRGIDDVVTLSPPGFGAPTPDGWTAAPDDYVAWLRDRLDRFDGPVDLVGHDWGTGHVVGLVVDGAPEHVRSWCVDVAGLFHPDYEWHEMAQTWQTDGAGEEAVGLFAALPTTDLAAAYEGLGMPVDVATPMAAAFDDEMARCILALYRAARQPHLRTVGEQLLATSRPPALVVNASDDAYVSAALSTELATRLDAPVLELAGHGHWWMLSATEVAADGLADFWSGLDA